MIFFVFCVDSLLNICRKLGDRAIHDYRATMVLIMVKDGTHKIYIILL